MHTHFIELVLPLAESAYGRNQSVYINKVASQFTRKVPRLLNQDSA
jgi:hypothetical protein